MRRGVYFIGDDGVLELAIAFLKSFRLHNPSLPLCLIPYSAKCQQLKDLQLTYSFFVYSNEEILSQCDIISTLFHGKVIGQYRKLATWEGPFDEFIYIDIDTVVLAAVDFAFAPLDQYDFLTSLSNMPNNVRWVWKPSIYSSGTLTRNQIEYGANTGVMISKKSFLSMQQVECKLAGALALAQHMTLFCTEQPLLNYLVVTSGKAYTSLLALFRKRSKYPIILEYWAGKPGCMVRGRHAVPPADHPPIFLMHWAGQWQPVSRDRRIHSLLQLVGMRGKNQPLIFRFFMKYKALWRYYRYYSGEFPNLPRPEPAAATSRACAAASSS